MDMGKTLISERLNWNTTAENRMNGFPSLISQNIKLFRESNDHVTNALSSRKLKKLACSYLLYSIIFRY